MNIFSCAERLLHQNEALKTLIHVKHIVPVIFRRAAVTHQLVLD